MLRSFINGDSPLLMENRIRWAAQVDLFPHGVEGIWTENVAENLAPHDKGDWVARNAEVR
jgi:hypothetical protein